MYKVLPPLAIAVLLIASCDQEINPSGIPSAEEKQISEHSSVVPGSLIIQLDEEQADLMAESPENAPAVFGRSLDALGIVSIERVYPDAGKWEARHRKAGLHRWYKLAYDPQALTATKAAADFSSLPGVVYVEPERRVVKTSFFNDPSAARQWNLYNDGIKPNTLAGCDVNVEPVWDNYTAGTPNVIVAVLDQGVAVDHPDLAANCFPVGPEGSQSFVNGYESTVNNMPDAHGTHVAGVIAAVNNNGLGISSIAGGYDGHGVKILSLAVLKENPRDPDHPIGGKMNEAMVWAADHGAVIAQNSWGYVFDTEEDALNASAGSMRSAIDYFVQYAGCDEDGNQLPGSPMKGGVIFFSAGNNAWSIGWPAADEAVIAVGATSAKFTRAYYSNYGDWVDICAPGGDATQNTLIYSTVLNGEYGNMQGTSMACPHASGVAALIVSHFGGPGFTNEMLKERLLGGASRTKIPASEKIGPMLDALGSFTYGSTVAPELPASIESESTSNNLTLSWDVTPDSEDIKAYAYLLLLSENAADFENLDVKNLPESVRALEVKVGTSKIGDSISATIPDLEFETTYYVTLVAYDYAGNYSAPLAVKAVQTNKNSAPLVATDYTGSFVLEPYDKINATYTVSDPDGHKFTVEIEPGSSAFKWNKSGDNYQISITGNGAPAGQYTAHIIATDAFGASTDYAIDYEILLNHAPYSITAFDNLLFTKTGERVIFDMSKYFGDEDGEQLSFSASMSDNKVVSINQSGNSLIVTAIGPGLTDVTITASDACKDKSTASFKALVRENTSVPVDLYPNPVVDKLNIRPAAEGQIEVSIFNKIGAKVWSGSGSAAPFTPFEIDLSGLPGGIYYVKVTGAGVNDTYTIAKK
ncbi:MAG: S8 family serine peptidase [Bacteroidales bacterium]|nr:S8 family serine peptidase [Bacteroidales bacterium]